MVEKELDFLIYSDPSHFGWGGFMVFLWGLLTFTTSLRIILNGKRFSLEGQYVAHECWALGMLFVYWIWDGTRHFLFWLNVCWYLSDMIWVTQYRKWLQQQTNSDTYWILRIICTGTLLYIMIQTKSPPPRSGGGDFVPPPHSGFVFINALVAFLLIPIAFIMWV